MRDLPDGVAEPAAARWSKHATPGGCCSRQVPPCHWTKPGGEGNVTDRRRRRPHPGHSPVTWEVVMFRSARTSLAIIVAAAATSAMMAAASPPGPAGRRAGPAFPRLRSLYVPMPDGVRLAVDVWLPAGTTAGAPPPTGLA